MPQAIDAVLGDLERGEFASAEQAAAAVLAVVFRINEELTRIFNEEEKARQLQRWAERLLHDLRLISERFEAVRFELSVGWPPSLSAAVRWGPSTVVIP